MLLAISTLLFAVAAETHQLEVIITDALGQWSSKLLLSNVKSSKPEATLEFNGSLTFPCTIRIPSSIHWDSIRYILITKVTYLN